MRYPGIVLTILLIAVLAVPARAHDALADEDLALFTEALDQAGLGPDGLALDLHDRSFYGGDRYRLAFFDALIADPLKISAYTRTLTDGLLAAAHDPGALVCSVQQRTGDGVRLGLIGDPLEPYRERCRELGDDCLAAALELHGTIGEVPETQLPRDVRDAAALLLLVMADARAYRDAALSRALSDPGLLNEERYEDLRSFLIDEEEAGAADEDIANQLRDLLAEEELAGRTDFALLNTGATLLAIAAWDAAAAIATAPTPDLGSGIAVETAAGTVAICSNSVPAGPGTQFLLRIDTTGDTTYYGGGASCGLDHPISVLIDTAGNDTYTAEGGTPAFGCGICGYGVVVDLAGDDTYSTTGPGQGCGIFGTGLLLDAAGNDSYDGVAGVQGSGTFGTGILADGGGNDVYHCYQFSQGYGFTRGAGLLLDCTGNDTYTADDSDIRFPAAQSAEHNSNLSQGFGFGRRGDYLDGHSWAGGVGMLVDGGGDDSYSCGIFGQGCGYWYGTGILADKDGADTYYGQWYCQGSGAHFALGILQDDVGDDTYTGIMNMCTGAGHDFSLGWLEDCAGNDSYACPNLSLGAGNANGIGVFWDHGGDDTYLSRGTTLGCASSVRPGSLRDFILTLGIFLDGAGDDTYLEHGSEDLDQQPFDFAANGTAWSRPGRSNPPIAAEKGGAVDR